MKSVGMEDGRLAAATTLLQLEKAGKQRSIFKLAKEAAHA